MNDNTALVIIISLIIITVLVFGGKPSINDGIVYMMEHTEKEIK